MEKVRNLAIDSMILIYLLEGNELFSKQAKAQLEVAENIILSTLALGEILVGFEKTKNKGTKLRFLSFVESYSKLQMIGFGKQEAMVFSELRAKYPQIKAPDAMHLSVAIASGADAFLTNDRALECVKEIPILLL